MIDNVRTVYILPYMTTVNVRIEEKTKKAASRVLASIGLDLSSGIKIFLYQVATEQGLPFIPTKNPAALRARLDAEFAEAIKGKGFKTGRDALKGL